MESMFIKWEKPDLNQQVKHINFDSFPICKQLSITNLNFFVFQYTILPTQCNKLCKIARDLNSTAISKYVTLKMTDVPSKNVCLIKESCYVCAAIYIVAALQTFYGYCNENMQITVTCKSQKQNGYTDDDRIVSHDAFLQIRHTISQSWQIPS